MKEGAREEQLKQFRLDLEHAFSRIRELKDKSETDGKLLIEINTNLQNLMKQVDLLGEKIERHTEAGA